LLGVSMWLVSGQWNVRRNVIWQILSNRL
jgi:hypothetical protein